MFNIKLSSYRQTAKIPFLMAGFRPFFLLAAIFAIFIMLSWSIIYLFEFRISMYQVSNTTWHAHEMIYGYSLAIIAGFLLTAVRNWTKNQTADGQLLLSLVYFWIVGRIPPINQIFSYIHTTGDILFLLVLLIILSKSLLNRKMIRQWPILIILAFLVFNNIGYYMSIYEFTAIQPNTFIYIALYLILNLLFIFSRRLIPNFIHSALKLNTPITTRPIIDKLVIPFFILFTINEIFFHIVIANQYLAIILFILNSIRLYDWYHNRIWRHQLLWSLYLGYFFLTFAFLLKAGEYFFDISPFLVLHMFTIGGLGLISTSMMARVSYGHTGRSIFKTNKSIKWIFVSIILSAIFRVIIPIFLPRQYVYFVAIGMSFWILAFLIFSVIFFKILTQAKPDGRYG